MRRRFIQTQGDIDINNYLTIEALEDGLTVKLTNGYSVYYCVNGSGKWKQLPIGIETSPINKGDTISFKDGDDLIRFSISKRCNLLGTIMSIEYGDYWTENSVAPLSTGMFQDCTTIVSVDENFLPATTLSENCYYALFYNCTSLINAPELPATTLAGGCYSSMFNHCTSLTTAPELPATALSRSCYSSMFNHCTSLTTAPELPATTLEQNCYSYMFRGCTSLNYIKMLAIYISASYCLYNWVNGVASSGTFVKNTAMTTLPTGTNGIPSGWTVQNATS